MSLLQKAFSVLGLIAVVVTASAAPASAGVSYKNGNFYIGYSDIILPGGIEPRVDRVYNSKSSHNGIFGFGWGSDYEVYLKVSADGSVMMHEFGGGAQNRFVPPTITQADINKAVDAIVQAKRKRTPMNAQAVEAEADRLKSDAHYRNEQWELLYNQGLVQARQIPENAILRSDRYSYQLITKTKQGYVRRFDNGQVQTFNNVGRLVRIADKNGNYLNISYDKTGHIAFIQDNLNRRLNFRFNKLGKVEQVQSEGKVATYKYVNSELVYSKDSGGNVYEYKYSSNGRHNLVEIKYADKTTYQVGYNPVEVNETVAWVKDRDGSVTEYTYGGEVKSPNPSYISTSVVSKSSSGKVLSNAKYEYWEKTKADGERYTAKLAQEVDGEKTETVYNESGLPTDITRGSDKTSFEYDSKAHVTKKTTPTEVTELAYDPVHGKVSKVAKYPKGDTGKKNVQWAEYQYDQRGNLVYAKNSEGKGVRIVYDHIGRIKQLVDQNKRQLQFKYNEANRPVEILDPAVGKIQVHYTNTGDIKKVDSSGGRKIALQVTSAFQNLLDIIRPAGVTLAF